MMITLEKATQKSMTCPSLSVHHTSFLWHCAPGGVGALDYPPFCSLQGSRFTLLTDHASTSPWLSRSSLVTFES